MSGRDAIAAVLRAEHALRECSHPLLPLPAFDEAAARDLPADEVRRRWPRGHAQCSDCGVRVISYASFMHYASGDW